MRHFSDMYRMVDCRLWDRSTPLQCAGKGSQDEFSATIPRGTGSGEDPQGQDSVHSHVGVPGF